MRFRVFLCFPGTLCCIFRVLSAVDKQTPKSVPHRLVSKADIGRWNGLPGSWKLTRSKNMPSSEFQLPPNLLAARGAAFSHSNCDKAYDLLQTVLSSVTLRPSLCNDQGLIA
ncbi:hypothetical protein BJV77DRAFT_243192 [Russula vinacea]|nr:hypothetical protein BJV77DRAFT_243192 [Russula vinacea]